MNPAAGLDLVSPNVGDRIADREASQGSGVIVSPGRPEGSVLYDRVQEMPMVGARMPLGSPTPLPAADVACIRDWISGLLPPPPEMDGGIVDCPECECPDIGATEACFSAAASLNDVGVCKGGTRTCLATPTGSYWGPCVDEVIPSPERCNTPEDEDCNGATPACSETWSFALATAATGQAARSVAVDSQDNVLVAGDFGLYREPDDGSPPGGLPNGKIDLGGGIFFADGAENGFYKDDVFLAKYDKNGNHLWSQRFGDTSNQTSTQVIVDADDNVILLGRAFGKIDFGDGVILDAAGTDDIFVAKFDGTTGGVLWSIIVGGIDPDRAERMAIDSDGDVWVAGTFTGTATFGDKGPFTSTGVRDGIVLEIDGESAAVRTALQFGGGSTDAANNKTGDNYGFGIGVYTDSSSGTPTDFIYVTGYFSNTMRIAGGPELTSAGGTDVFVAKLDAVGGHVWSRAAGGPLDDVAHDLVVDPSNGSVAFTGFFQDTMDFGGGDSITSAGLNDFFLAKLDADGNHLFSKGYGDAGDQRDFGSYKTNTWTALDIDAEGNIFLGGPLVGSGNFGPAPIVSPEGKMDVFIAKFDPAGNHIYSKRYGDGGTQIGLDVAVASSGHVLLVGRFYSSSIAFEPATGTVRGIGVSNGISSAGDGFVARVVVD